VAAPDCSILTLAVGGPVFVEMALALARSFLRWHYATARELEPHYDALGLVRLRDRPNDELLMALAMGLHGMQPVADDGSVMADLLAFPQVRSLDVLSGSAHLGNRPSAAGHQPWNSLTDACPSFVHFLGHHAFQAPYTAEAAKLRMASRGVPAPVARAAAALGWTLPATAGRRLKDVGRPLYRRILGVRPIAQVER